VERVASAVDNFQEMMNDPTLIPRWLPTPKNMRHRRALETLDEIVYGFIRERREHMEDKGDLLSMLLLSVDEEDGTGMNDKQVRDEAVTLFLAGHETTANALNWTWYLLSNNPQVEAKLHHELDTVLGGNPPTLADLRRLPYTDMVIKESMRLYPPAWSIGRAAAVDTEVMGYTIPKGSNVNIVTHRVQRHASIWSNPNDFIPERWLAENSENIPRYAYLPFGGGPRVCIGNSFATMEANLLLATIAQSYQLRVKDGANIVPQPFITLFPRDGMPMRIEKRQVSHKTEKSTELEMA
jgi:cytochrome P450